MASTATQRQSVVKKFISDGLMNCELDDYFCNALAPDGYAGLDIISTRSSTDIIIKASRTREVVGDKERKLKEMQCEIENRFNFERDSCRLYAELIDNRGFSAAVQCESLKFKLLGGMAVRRAVHSIMRFVMKNGAKGVEVIVSGKVRAQRAKAMKFSTGYLLSTGAPKETYVDTATRKLGMKQGMLGLVVKIMKPHDPTGKHGVKDPLPDQVTILEPKQ